MRLRGVKSLILMYGCRNILAPPPVRVKGYAVQSQIQAGGEFRDRVQGRPVGENGDW